MYEDISLSEGQNGPINGLKTNYSFHVPNYIKRIKHQILGIATADILVNFQTFSNHKRLAPVMKLSNFNFSHSRIILTSSVNTIISISTKLQKEKH